MSFALDPRHHPARRAGEVTLYFEATHYAVENEGKHFFISICNYKYDVDICL